MKSFKLVGAFSNVLSKPEIFRLIGKVCLYVVLFLIIRNCNDSVRLGNMYKQFAKAVLIVKYMVNLDVLLSHADNDSRRE